MHKDLEYQQFWSSVQVSCTSDSPGCKPGEVCGRKDPEVVSSGAKPQQILDPRTITCWRQAELFAALVWPILP